MTTPANPFKGDVGRPRKGKRKMAQQGNINRFAADVEAARAGLMKAQASAAQAIAAPNEVDIAEKAHLAFELRRRGAGYTAIARLINATLPPSSIPMTRKSVCELVTTYIAELDTETRESTKTTKRLELDRLDALIFGKTGLDGLFERARAGEMAAIDRFLAVQRQRLGLLGIPLDKLVVEGGDRPVRVEDPVTVLFVKLQAAVAARRALNTGPATVNMEPEAVNGNGAHVNGNGAAHDDET